MSDFMTQIQNQEIVFSENGAIMNKTSGSKLVDMNFMIPTLRKKALRKQYASLYKDFAQIYNENNEYALRWLLYSRDARCGIGERIIFRALLVAIGQNDPLLLNKILTLDIQEFGRFDDYVSIYKLVDNKSKDLIVDKIRIQLEKDLLNIDKNVSLLAKWLPSAQTSSKSQRRLAETLAKKLGMPIKAYRKMLSALRKASNVVETKMCLNEWSDIVYSHVPSKANLKYDKAFLKHDKERRLEYINDVMNGKTKVNTSVLFPSDIVNSYCSLYHVDQSLENAWNNLKVFDGFKDTLVVRDGSGSMLSCIPGTKMRALDVANALTLYCCQNNTGQYKNKFITFSSRPQVVDISGCETLNRKLIKLNTYDDFTNTNIKAVFDIILNTALANSASQEELPHAVLIISDMEFDSCSSKNHKTLMRQISERWKEEGYEMPKLIFWNVNSRTNGIPITQDKSGTVLLSGYSQNLLEMAMSSKTDPLEILLEKLSDPRYDCVKSIL